VTSKVEGERVEERTEKERQSLQPNPKHLHLQALHLHSQYPILVMQLIVPPF
jgi:hypothetical protein